MSRAWLALVACAALLCAGCVAPTAKVSFGDEDEDAGDDQTVRIAGVTRDEAGVPLAQVDVRLMLLDGPAYAAFSDGEGRFAFVVPPAKDCSLRAAKVGYEEAALDGHCTGDANVPIAMAAAKKPPPSTSPPGSSPPGSSPPPSDPPPGGPPPSDPAPEPRYDPGWPSLASARIRPGTALAGGGCTSNFVFSSPDNRTLYLGTAAHCFSQGDNTQTNGCTTPTDGLDSTIAIGGASRPGRLVYSSWVTMQERHEANTNTCRLNDFALLEIHEDDRANVHPAMLRFGGPTGLAAKSQNVGTKVMTYGNTWTRPGDTVLDEHEGYVVGNHPDGWGVSVYTVGPGIPGDSGSGVLVEGGGAMGVMVTLQSVPPGANGVTGIAKALEYANAHGAFGGAELATWSLIDPGYLP